MGDEKFVRKGPMIPLPESTQPFGTFLLERLRSHPEKTRLIYGETGDSANKQKLLSYSISVALELRARGVKPGDVVVFANANSLETVYSILGISYVGAVGAPVNPDLHIDDLRHLVELMEPKLLLSKPNAAEKFRAVLPAGVPVISLQKGDSDWDAFLGHSAAEIAEFQSHTTVDPDELFCIMPSSGTTGPAKGVMMTHRNWHIFILSAEIALREMAGGKKIDETVMQVTANYWLAGFFTIILHLAIGNTLVIYPKFDVDIVLGGVQKYKATTLLMSPHFLTAIAKHPNVENYDVSSLLTVSFSGAALSPALQDIAGKRLKKYVQRYYASTESLLVVVPGLKSPTKPGTIGQVALNVALKIVDYETGKILGPNAEGEICFKSVMAFKGYYKNPKATQETIDKDGWVHTGDVGYYDEDGYFYIVDRYKELIKFRGNKVYPSELEDILTAHKAVKDAAIVGVPHDEDQEHPVAFIVLQDGQKVSKEELVEMIKDLPDYKQLHGGIHFVNDIPRNASHKIKRRELRQLARKIVAESPQKS